MSNYLNLDKQSPPVEIGKIVRPHGVRGNVKVILFNKQSNTLCIGRKVVADSNGKQTSLTIVDIKPLNDGKIITFKEVTTIEEAETLRGHTIVIPYDELPPCDPGEFFIRDLIGMTVTSANGDVMGVVDENTQSGEVAVFHVRNGNDVEYIPFLKERVAEIDIKKRIIKINDNV